MDQKMLAKGLEKNQQRWLAVGLLLMLVAVLVSLVLVPVLFQVYEYRESIDNLQFRLDRYNRKIARKDDLIRHIAKTREELEQTGYFGLYKTAAMASADLQKQVKHAVTSSGGQLTSTQALPPKDMDGLTEIVIKVRLSGSLEAIADSLYKIETGLPYMVVEKLKILSVRGRRNRRTRKLEQIDKVNVNMEIRSFMQVTDL
jgi:general secretion pathway protein M